MMFGKLRIKAMNNQLKNLRKRVDKLEEEVKELKALFNGSTTVHVPPDGYTTLTIPLIKQ